MISDIKEKQYKYRSIYSSHLAEKRRQIFIFYVIFSGKYISPWDFNYSSDAQSGGTEMTNSPHCCLLPIYSLPP